MNFRELAFDVIVSLLGLGLFIWATPLASALNHWAAQQYVRFPKMKSLPGAANAGKELNAKIASVWFRICGAVACLVSLVAIAQACSWRADNRICPSLTRSTHLSQSNA
jgi:hypothetical protein